MVRAVLLSLGLALLAVTLPAASIQLGAPFTFSAPEPGLPGGWPRILTSWIENGQTFAVIQRDLFGVARTFRAPLRGDGTVDNAAAVPLEIPAGTAVVARRGSEMLAVVESAGGLQSVRLDTMGHALAPRTGIYSPLQPVLLACSEKLCVVSTLGPSFLLDAEGQAIRTIEQGAFAAAAPHTILLRHCTSYNCLIELLDDHGAVKKTLPYLAFDDMVYDGSRFVAVISNVGGMATRVTMWTIDPESGAISSSDVTDYLFNGGATARLAWNGSTYGIAMDVQPLPPFTPARPTIQTFRVARNLVPLEAPREMGAELEGYVDIVPHAGGFVIVSFSQARITRVASMLRNDGTLLAPPQPLVSGLSSQTFMTATSSASARLMVWEEGDSEQFRIRAARRARTGELLDERALTLANSLFPIAATATSDGDGFLVAWLHAFNLSGFGRAGAALIDPAGNVRKIALDVTANATTIKAEFVNGAYQIVAISVGGVDAFTVDRGGTLLLHEQLKAETSSYEQESTDAVFDGRRIAAVWINGGSVWSAVKDVGQAPAPPRTIIGSNANVVLRRNPAGGYLLLYSIRDATATPTLVRLSPDGELLPGTTRLHVDGQGFSDLELVRLGGDTYASWRDLGQPYTRSFRALVRFDPVTLAAGAQSKAPDLSNARLIQMVEGWDGEAFLLSSTLMDTEVGPIELPTMQAIFVDSHTRAVRH